MDASGDIRPRYRGAFEPGDRPPGRIRIIAVSDGGPAPQELAVRFIGSRGFGVSVEVDPAVWGAPVMRKGWFLFRSGSCRIGLWSSLPATPLPPPGRELWTFGRDHIWVCRILHDATSTGVPDISGGRTANPPQLPGTRGGRRIRTAKIRHGQGPRG